MHHDWEIRIDARIEKAAERIRARHPRCSTGWRARPTPRRWSRSGSPRPTPSWRPSGPRRRRWPGGRSRPSGRWSPPCGASPIDEVADTFSVRYGGELALPHEAAEAIARRQAAHQERMLADDPVGREIARLEAEKENLLDTVWLAGSPAQIKQLWTKVAELLGDEPTALEREALAIEPAKEA